MYTKKTTTLSSVLREAQIGNIPVPAGDRGEQLIAYLILSGIAAQVHTIESARAYIAQAHAIAEWLSRHALTYRPPRLSRFARVTFEAEGETDFLMFSIINDILVMPIVNPQDVALHKLPAQTVVNLKGIEVAYFKLRLRTAKLAGTLQPLKHITSGEELAMAVDGILRECLYNEITSVEPLDIASDFFTLAHALVGTCNAPLAVLALQNADRSLDLYTGTTPVKNHPPQVLQMKQGIATVSRELRDFDKKLTS